MLWMMLLLVVLVGCTPDAEQPGVVQEEVAVTRVLDGDTFMVLLHGKQEKVRLLGVNAPELGKECFGAEAKAFLEQLLKGETVVLEWNTARKSRDRYKRLLRTVYVNGTDVALLLVQGGYANVYTQWEDEHALTYAVYEEEALRTRRGLWNCTDLRKS